MTRMRIVAEEKQYKKKVSMLFSHTIRTVRVDGGGFEEEGDDERRKV